MCGHVRYQVNDIVPALQVPVTRWFISPSLCGSLKILHGTGQGPAVDVCWWNE